MDVNPETEAPNVHLSLLFKVEEGLKTMRTEGANHQQPCWTFTVVLVPGLTPTEEGISTIQNIVNFHLGFLIKKHSLHFVSNNRINFYPHHIHVLNITT